MAWLRYQDACSRIDVHDDPEISEGRQAIAQMNRYCKMKPKTFRRDDRDVTGPRQSRIKYLRAERSQRALSRRHAVQGFDKLDR
jgi:hypothetical protein